MLSNLRTILIGLVVLGFSAATVSAGTYYVDFANGNDAADGKSPESAWKHSPGDRNATDKAGKVVLAGGDTVLFRGGVVYHGSIELTVSGKPGQPIVLDGNTAGTFGEGRAIFDGGQVIDNWVRCKSQKEADGNPRWKKMFYADVDIDISSNFNHGKFVAHRQVPKEVQAPWQRVILIDGNERLLPIAQMPKPEDNFYPDRPGDFYHSKHKLEVWEDKGVSIIKDEVNLVAKQADYYDGMFVGVHGGNNHTYFAAVKEYDAKNNRLATAVFKPRIYNTTRYALFNSARLITQPGEWSVKPLGNGKSRFYLLPDRLVDDKPVNIGFPVYATGIALRKGASHVQVKGFLIQRYSGGSGGVSVGRNNPRAKDIVVENCEIRFLTGHAGVGLNYCDQIIVKDCVVYSCPGWTTGVFLSRVNNYVVSGCRLTKNSGSGIRHYECKDGVLRDNVILDHFGMHSSGINLYEGCDNIVLEGNYIQNTVAINRNAQNIVFRNNVIDGLGKTTVCVAMWTSGSVGGRNIRNLTFENNSFVNVSKNSGYASGIFGQVRKGYSSPEGLVIRNNILDGIYGDVNGVFENNLYLRQVDGKFMGGGCSVVKDGESKLFVDPAKGDFRRRAGGKRMDVGANVAGPNVQTKVKPTGR